MNCFVVLLVLATPSARASSIVAARTVEVRSVETFCDLLLSGLGHEAVASTEVIAHAQFFDVAARAMPRLDGPDDVERARSFARMENLAARHGARKSFVEMVAGLDQVGQVTRRTLARLNGATAGDVRREVARAFAPQLSIFEFIRTRHEALEATVQREIDVWIGHAFVTEVERLRATLDLTHLYPPDLRPALEASVDPRRRDPQLARWAYEKLGRAVLAVFGAPGLEFKSRLRPQDTVANRGDLGSPDLQ